VVAVGLLVQLVLLLIGYAVFSNFLSNFSFLQFIVNDHTVELMSPEHPVQCDSAQSGCNGGYVGKAFDFQVANGFFFLIYFFCRYCTACL
jgi:hypothetical protein